MGLFIQSSSDYSDIRIGERVGKALLKQRYDEFGIQLLGLGDLNQKSDGKDVIAINFDLVEFSRFCSQPDPHLNVPHFLQSFLRWLMNQLKTELTANFEVANFPPGKIVPLHSLLPFFVKFTGDGLLVLFDASIMTAKEQRNIIIVGANIRYLYQKKFFKEINKKYADAPPDLRCGIARGTAYSLGGGNDYVGSCINMSCRLLRLPGFHFAFSRRGFDLDGKGDHDFFDRIIFLTTDVRGISENEIVGIEKAIWDTLSPNDKESFRLIG